MRSAYTRKGTMIFRYSEPHYFCLTFTGARWKLWRLRRAERIADPSYSATVHGAD